jgi:hypothetical protein
MKAQWGWIAATSVLSGAASACDPTVIIGERLCPQSPSASPDASSPDAGTAFDPDASVPLSWTTGFEDGFCSYTLPSGFCIATGSSSYTLVTSPVHSGQYAAAFTVPGTLDGGSQARCVEQGVFPDAAYYGAWYFIPASEVNLGVWNLFHFQGGVPGMTQHGLWDVSLVNLADGGALHIVFFDFLTGTTPNVSAVPSIPIGKWFHLEVYFKRAHDATGQLTVLQDGVVAVNLSGLETDDTHWGQWFVGSFANALFPPSATVYVDDVTIGAAP